jgi:MFS family permease
VTVESWLEVVDPIAQLGRALALLLYASYNLAAILASIPAGHVGDGRGMLRTLAAGAVCFLLAYTGFAVIGQSIALLGGCFVLAAWASTAARRPRAPPSQR